MSRKYLLPCQCGRKVAVEATQAGQRIHCDCGTVLDVPTLLGLAKLEPVVDQQAASEARRRAWGSRQIVALLGGLIFLLAIATLAALWATRPKAPDMQRLAPFDAMVMWDAFQQGIGGEPSPPERRYADALAWYVRWLSLAGAVAVVGVVLIGAAFLVKPRPAQDTSFPDQPSPRDRASST